MSNRVHPAVKELEPPDHEPVVDRVIWDGERAELSTRRDAVLGAHEFSDGPVDRFGTFTAITGVNVTHHPIVIVAACRNRDVCANSVAALQE